MKLGAFLFVLTLLGFSGFIWNRSYKKSDLLIPYFDDFKTVHVTSAFGVMGLELTTYSTSPYTGHIDHPWKWHYHQSPADTALRYYGFNEAFGKADYRDTFAGVNGSQIPVRMRVWIVPDWAFVSVFSLLLIAMVLHHLFKTGRQKAPGGFPMSVVENEKPE